MTCVTRDSTATGCGRRVAGSLRRRRRLRVSVATLAVILLAPAAVAADFDDAALRGSFDNFFTSKSYSRWDGVYFGGQIGASSGTVNYSDSLSSLIDYILRNSLLQSEVTDWTTMGRESTRHSNYGAFLGYNFQLADQLVLGPEVNYSHVGLNSNTSDTITRIIQNDSQAPTGHHFFYTTTVSGNASVQITDFATFRVRAGWQVGQFLPYAFGGLAVGRANYSRSATVAYTTEDIPDTTDPVTPPNPPPNFGPVSRSEAQGNAIAYGFAAGLGVDVAILPNVFLRAEWEYVQFAPIHDIQVNINSGRVGIGLKF